MKDTTSTQSRRAQKARSRRYQTKVTKWLNSRCSGPPPQASTWFPELPAILIQAGLLAKPPVNFYIPIEELSDEDNRYEAQLARNRARYAADSLEAGQPYRPGNVVAAEIVPDATSVPITDEGDVIIDSDIEYEMARVRRHAENCRRANLGKPPLPIPPRRLAVGSREWWATSTIAGQMPTIDRCQEAAFRLALSGDIELEAQSDGFQVALAAWVGKQE